MSTRRSTLQRLYCMMPRVEASRRQDGCTRLRPLALACAVVAAGAASGLRADTIHLKNGREIVAEVTREDSRQVYFNRDGNEYAIPRSLVDHIDKISQGGDPDAMGSAATRPDLPLPSPPAEDPPVGSEVVKDGDLNQAYLLELDRSFERNSNGETRHALDQGYMQAAIFLIRQGRNEEAIQQYRHALILDPDSLSLTLGLGYLLIRQNRSWDAIQALSPAADRHPDSADVHLLLGSAYYAMEDLTKSIAEWKKSLALHDDDRVKAALQRAEKEQGVTGTFGELRSEHFILRYDEGAVRDLANQSLETLENDFLSLEQDLDYYPREPIIVIFYPNQAFRDITRLPDWVGAVNDGKIRVPVSGLTALTPEIARVLKHELTHSFVHRMTEGRCPVWFNEGLAQLEEGSSTEENTAGLVAEFSYLPPYSALERSFLNLPPGQVPLVYAKSLAALEYLRDTWGMVEIRRLLNLLRSNPDFNAALGQELRLDYPHFERGVLNYLEARSK